MRQGNACNRSPFGIDYFPMKGWRVQIVKPASLLPFILAVSLFLAVQGMRMPNGGFPSKPKPNPRAVCEAQAKEIQEKIASADQVAELGRHACCLTPPDVRASVSPQSASVIACPVVSFIPARAPPLRS
jgi:hypothetical protein